MNALRKLRGHRLALAAIVLIAMLLFVAMPAWSSTGGVGNQNLQASDCSAHSSTSPATIAMSASSTTVAPGDQITVSVTVTGGSSLKMGAALLSKTVGSTGTTPKENGWTIVSDPVGTTYNYVEKDYTGSITFTWTMKTPATAGSFKLYAKIFHGNAAYVKTDSIGLTFTVSAPTVNAPVVTITAPTAAATLSGTASVSATVTADASTTVSKADLLVDNVLVSSVTTAPYTWSLNTISYANGAHTLTVNGYDAGGRMGTSQVSVTISNAFAAPTVVITAPAANATVTGTLTVTATATPDTGRTISKVQLTVEGALVGTVTAAPYTWSWNSNLVANAAHTLVATATDDLGQTGTAQVSVTVSNAPTPPILTITAPANLRTVAGTISVTASITPTGGKTITSASASVDSTSLGTNTVAPFTWQLNTYTLSRGSHAINVTATDSGGLTSTAKVTIDVNNDAPAIEIVTPSNGTMAVGTLSVLVNATTAIGMPSVTLAVDGTAVSTINASPYAWNLNTTGYTDGPHILSVTAKDANGNASSVIANIIVANNLAEISLMSPANTTINGTVQIQVAASSSVGITLLAMYFDGKELSSVNATSTNATVDTSLYLNGKHYLVINARDGLGRNSTRNITLTVSNGASSISLIMDPAVSGTTTLSLNVNGNDPIVNATLRIDGAKVSTLNATPMDWQVDTTGYADGEHTANVTAYTASGKIVFANVVFIVQNALAGPAFKLELTGLDLLLVQGAVIIVALGLVLKKARRPDKK